MSPVVAMPSPEAPQLFAAPALPQEPAPAAPAPSKQFFSGAVERSPTPVRPDQDAPSRVPKFIADMPSPKVPVAAPKPVPASAPAPVPAPTAPAAPLPFSLPAWADAAKKEGAKGSVALALKGCKADVADGKAVLWASNEPNAAILGGATGLLEVAYRATFGGSVAVEVRLRERADDPAAQAAEIFG